MKAIRRKSTILLWRFLFAIVLPVLLTTPAVTQDHPTEEITGSISDSVVEILPSHSPRIFLRSTTTNILPASPEQVASVPGAVEIIPASPTSVGNCVPFGSNTGFGFTGFIYRNVPAFTLFPGDQFAFDLGNRNNVDTRRNIYFAVANKNPAPGGCASNVVSQGIRALEWIQVVSDTQVPLNPRGNTVKDDYELVYTAEATFHFPGGGFIVGFGGSPPGGYADMGCEQVLVNTNCNDASGLFYARFFMKPDRTLDVLDVLTGGNGNGSVIGGMAIWPSDGSNQSPVARCKDIRVSTNSGCVANASVDDGSFDPDGSPITISQSPAGPYPVGSTMVTLSVTDSQGASDSCTAMVTVVDATPPTITSSNWPITLWPPNSQYVTVKVTDCISDVSDSCDPSIGLNDVAIKTVSSDEPEDAQGNGDGNTLNDIVIAPDCRSVQLRAERAGAGNGRVYTITFRVRDASGNEATATRQVTVPRNQGRGDAAQNDGPVYTVMSYCP